MITADDVDVNDVVSLPGTTWRVPARVVTVGLLGDMRAFTVEDPETGEIRDTAYMVRSTRPMLRHGRRPGVGVEDEIPCRQHGPTRDRR